METDQPEDAISEAGALLRLALKVAFAQRGEYLAEYLDDRRMRRAARRLRQLGDFAESEGMSIQDLLERVQDDDEAAEFLDEVIDTAAKTRYKPKLRYLARCLANAIASHDDAVPDLAWAKVEAVRNLEAIHVRLLHDVKAAQDWRAEVLYKEHVASLTRPLAVEESVLIEDKQLRHHGITVSAFHPSWQFCSGAASYRVSNRQT